LINFLLILESLDFLECYSSSASTLAFLFHSSYNWHLSAKLSNLYLFFRKNINSDQQKKNCQLFCLDNSIIAVNNNPRTPESDISKYLSFFCNLELLGFLYRHQFVNDLISLIG